MGWAGPTGSRIMLWTCASGPGGLDPSLRKGTQAQILQVQAGAVTERLLFVSIGPALVCFLVYYQQQPLGAHSADEDRRRAWGLVCGSEGAELGFELGGWLGWEKRLLFPTHTFLLPSHSCEEPLSLAFLICKMGAKTASYNATGGVGK